MFVVSKDMQLNKMSALKLLISLILFFFFFLLSFAWSAPPFANNTHTCSSQQSLALLLFKENLLSTNHLYEKGNFIDFVCHDWLGSDYNPIMMNWDANTDCCDWNGVSCDLFNGDVIGLDLSCGMLRGTINPNTSLFHLPRLQRLNLAFNDFIDSQIPGEIGRFSRSLTHLNLSDSGLVGQIPSEISYLSKLVSLDLSWNGYGFQILPYVLSNLLSNCTLLRELTLLYVDISSVLPTYVNISSLKLLNLHSTNLQGKLPYNIFNLQYLEKLDLAGNSDITGQLPNVNTSITIPLKWLDLSHTNLSGEIPESIGHLNSLNYLDLSFCGFIGSLPTSLANLKHLTSIDLSSNMLNGKLPFELFTLTAIENIYLDNNMFSGGLPLDVFDCRSLKKLSLHNNKFEGEINQASTRPSFINLTYFDLSANSFTGLWDLDTFLSSLPNLEVLHLSYNDLSVFTTSNNHYADLDLREVGLASCKLNVFPEFLRAKKNLQVLDLSNNGIHGSILDWTVEIGRNELSYLNLSHNSITELPRFQWDGLESLYLQSNLIQGPFPLSICNMSNLNYLDISNNSFKGVIPQCFGNISSFLWMVDLSNNQFHGTIPNVYEDCEQLVGLVLNDNQLEGEVPPSLSECQSLQILDLGNNHLNGTFPGWLGDLSELQVLVLRSNFFHGPIETTSAVKLPFPSLRVLDVSHNGFTGYLPRKYFQNFNVMKNVLKNGSVPEYLNFYGKYYSIIVVVKGQQLLFQKISIIYTIIDLSSNRFEGEIPIIIGSLNCLKVLNLSHNNLKGQIPISLGNLSEIESLDLSWNQLTGRIPQILADITTLEVLNLSQNHLVGRIPEGKQFSTFEGNSFGGNLELCGFPLPKHCEHLSFQPVDNDVNDDDEEEDVSGFTWKVVMLGYGCGTLFGLVLGYLMLSTKKPKWFNSIADAVEKMILNRRKKRRHIYIGK